MSYKLLSVNADSKTKKGVKFGYLTGILYLAPHTIGGSKTLCPFSTAGCRAVCLYSAGRGGFTSVQNARIRKTKWWNEDSKGFLAQLRLDIKELERQAKILSLLPAVRLNGTSDIMWSKTGIMKEFPDVQFYGYTKWPAHKYPALEPNEQITYSFSEAEHAPEWAKAWMDRGANVAVVFHGGLPSTFLGRPVIDGDESDLRFLDKKGVIVGLVTKGKARSAKYGEGHFIQLGKAA